MHFKLLIAFFFFLYTPTHAQKKNLEDKITDTIFKLKEIREKAHYIEKASKGKRHLGVAIYSKPSHDTPYYWVKVWEDNGISNVTYYNFYVYPKTFTIKFYDISEDKIISLEHWRQHQVKHENSN